MAEGKERRYEIIVCLECGALAADSETLRSQAGCSGTYLLPHGPTQQVEVLPVEEHQAALAAKDHDLAECYRLTGSDPDGDSDSMLAQHAVQAVRELREESERVGEWEDRAIKAEAALAKARTEAGGIATAVSDYAAGRFDEEMATGSLVPDDELRDLCMRADQLQATLGALGGSDV